MYHIIYSGRYTMVFLINIRSNFREIFERCELDIDQYNNIVAKPKDSCDLQALRIIILGLKSLFGED